MLWMGMGGHRSLLMGVVWVWVQIRRQCWTLITIFHMDMASVTRVPHYLLWPTLQRCPGYVRLHICPTLFTIISGDEVSESSCQSSLSLTECQQPTLSRLGASPASLSRYLSPRTDCHCAPPIASAPFIFVN